MRNPIRKLLSLATLAVLSALPFSGCLSDGGTEIPNELTGTLYTSSGAPAVNAHVRVLPVDFAPDSTSTDTAGLVVRTNASGRYVVSGAPEGYYSVVAQVGTEAAFRDSVLVTGASVTVPGDTLRAAGSITGRVGLQPHHDPRTAVVQILGTNFYSNVGADGGFTLEGVPKGRYRLRVNVLLAQYTPLYLEVVVGEGRHDTLPTVLTPFYSGIPVVAGLQAGPDTVSVARVRWSAVSYPAFQAYRVYRDAPGSLSPSNLVATIENPLDTTFTDTVFALRYGQSPGADQYPFTDTVSRSFRYRVIVVNKSSQSGLAFGYASAHVIAPGSRLRSGRWHLGTASPSFGRLFDLKPVVFQNALWLFGKTQAAENSTKTQIWKSTDGLQWNKVNDSLVLPTGAHSSTTFSVTAYRDTLWLMGDHADEATGVRYNYLRKSVDGVTWTAASDRFLPTNAPRRNFPPIEVDSARIDFAFLTLGTRLLVVGGAGASTGWGTLPGYFSEDGASWQPLPLTYENACCPDRDLPQGYALYNAPTHAVHQNRIWTAGGMRVEFSIGWIYNAEMWSSGDGGLWRWAAATPPPLPRYGHSLTSHAGALWMVAGVAEFKARTGEAIMNQPVGTLTNQAWRSTDGLAWELVDLNAPFAPRQGHAAVSFKGRLWIIGGTSQNDDVKNDIWYYE